MMEDWYGNVDVAHLVISPTTTVEELERALGGSSEALRHVNQFGRLPLHYAVDRLSSQLQPAVLRFLVQQFPEAVAVRDKEGMSPYDLCYRWGHPRRVKAILLAADESLDPDLAQRIRLGGPIYYTARYCCCCCGDTQDAYVHRRGSTMGPRLCDGYNNNDLHQAFSRDSITPGRLRQLLVEVPDGAKQRNQFGRLPLHYAVDRSAVSLELVRVLLAAYPAAARERDGADQSPWDLATKWRHGVRVRYALLCACPDLDPPQHARLKRGLWMYYTLELLRG